MWSKFTHGHLNDVDGDSVAEGIGQRRVTANVALARRDARERGPGRTLVAILCDGGARYAATIHDPRWLAARGVPVPIK